MMNDVIFFNCTVANDTGLIQSAINEEDMNIEANYNNSFNAPIFINNQYFVESLL